MEEGRLVEAVQAKSMKGFLWFGTAGVALAIGGLIALLAANWYTIPFAVQVAVAMAPLVAAWGVYAWMLWRGVTSLAAHEVLGVLWTGGVVCSIALLGRVLQLSSSALDFCLAVTVLLLPVVFATRATAAWMTAWGFVIASAGVAMDTFRGKRAEIAVLILLTGIALLLPCISRFWRDGGLHARGQRWLAALMAMISLAFLLVFVWCRVEIVPAAHPIFLLCGWSLLGVGAWVERQYGPGGRPLSILGLLIPVFGIFMGIVEAPLIRLASPLWWVVMSVLLVAGLGRWLLRNEGIFLLLLPVMSVALYVGRMIGRSSLLLTIGALLVGIVAIAYGVRAGKRAVANEGLIFTLLSAWFSVIAMRLELMVQGVLLIAGGIALFVANLLLSRGRKGGRQ